VARPQEPAEYECKGVVDDQALDLLGEALLVVLVVLRHQASPASCLRRRWPRREPGGDHVEPGDTPSRR